MVKISQAKPHNTEDIKVFYSQCGYGGDLSTLEEDLILIAQLEEKIVGAVRLCPNTGFFVFRGMQVLAKFQQQGIGTRLLYACTEQLVNQVCYCIPWQHLRSFYQQAGFQEVAPVGVPDLLHERFDNYISKGMNVILMCRSPHNNLNAADGRKADFEIVDRAMSLTSRLSLTTAIADFCTRLLHSLNDQV